MLSRTFVELADTLVDDFDMVDLLTLLVERCVDVLGVSAAGLMLAAPAGGLRVVASSSETMRIVELFELQSQEGPCLDCFHTGTHVMNPNLAEAPGPWPTFAPVALDEGFRSVHALPMRLRGQVIGALNLFRSETGPLDADDVLAGQALADMATISILQHRAVEESQTLAEQLTIALNSRIVVEQAKGMVVGRTGLDMTEAFSGIRNYARRNNARLVDVAEAIIAGTLTVDRLDL